MRDELEAVLEDLDIHLKLERVECFHLNDSKVELGSRKDRHANLGEGLIGIEAITNIINHPRLKHMPFVLETPALKDLSTAKIEVKKLRSLAKD